MSDDRRLIEEELPLREVNAASAREKSLRHGHISTLHLWWARRPLAMSRAVVLGTLLPDPGDAAERDRICELIADASQFEASIQPHRIGPLRELIAQAYPDGPPKVLDCFAGGGAIPLEALRLGCDTTALDLNPVAHLIERCVLEYPQRFGQPDPSGENPLARDFVAWAGWVRDQVAHSLAEVFPTDASGRRPAVYFWCRTMRCPNPACGVEIPLLSSFWLARSSRRNAWLEVRRESQGVAIDVCEGSGADGRDLSAGTVRASSVTCPACQSVVSAPELRRYAKAEGLGERLVAVLEIDARHRTYRAPRGDEVEGATRIAAERLSELDELPDGLSAVPNEEMPSSQYRRFGNLVYGIEGFGALFNDRQLYVLGTLCEAVRAAHVEMLACGVGEERAEAITTYLGFLVDKIADYDSSFTSWRTTAEASRGTFPRQAIAMVWDYVETNPFPADGGIWEAHVRWIELAIRHCSLAGGRPAEIVRGNAQELPFADGEFDAVVVDPPYYDAFQYGDLSDFFYVWLKRSIGHLHPSLFASPLTPKSQEVIETRADRRSAEYVSHEEFERRLSLGLAEMRRVVKPGGVVTIVFAHTDVAAWERLLRALRSARLVVSTSWPMRSERSARPTAQISATLDSSVVLVCRAQEAVAEGFYDDVVQELEERVADRLDAFEHIGLKGADYFVSAVGPAFEVFARYGRVVKLSGDEVDVSELMALARQAVARHALRRLLGEDSLRAVDSSSLFYLTWRWAYLTADLPADEAYKLERAFDVDMDDLLRPGGVITRSGSTFKLLGPHERRDLELSVSPPLIDVLHAACRFWDAGRRQELADLLGATGLGGEPGFWAVARVLGEVLPEDSRERRMLLGLGGNRDALERAAEESTATAEELHLFDPGFDMVVKRP